MNRPKRRKPGPVPDEVRADLDWEEAVRRALSKKRPAGGWPKPSKPAKKRRKK